MSQNHLTTTVVASGDFTGEGFRHRLIDYDGTLSQAASAVIAGSLRNPQRNTSDTHLSVTVLGDAYLVAGGAVGIGAKLAAANSGWVTAATSAQIAAGQVIGKAQVAANSGDIFNAFLGNVG